MIDLVDFDGHDFLQLLDFLLHLHGLRRLIAEAVDERLHIGDFLLLVLVGAKLLFATLFPQFDIIAVFHAIVDNLTTRYFQRAIRDIVDESTVVADENHRRAARRQKLLQPLNRLDVKVVRGLVEQQHVGTAQQNLRQFDAHTPTARKFTRRTLEIRAQETQSEQRALDFRLVVLAAEHQVALVLLREPLHQRHIFVALIVGSLGQFALHTVDFRLQARRVGESLARLLGDGRRVGQLHHLRQIAHRRVRRNVHHATRRLLLSAQDFQQRRFPRAVLAHERNAVAVVHHEVRPAKQRLHAKFHFQIFYGYHRNLLDSVCKVTFFWENIKKLSHIFQPFVWSYHKKLLSLRTTRRALSAKP